MHRATSNEQRTTNNEQRATGNGQRATSNEQRATSNEQRTERPALRLQAPTAVPCRSRFSSDTTNTGEDTRQPPESLGVTVQCSDLKGVSLVTFFAPSKESDPRSTIAEAFAPEAHDTTNTGGAARQPPESLDVTVQCSDSKGAFFSYSLCTQQRK